MDLKFLNCIYFWGRGWGLPDGPKCWAWGLGDDVCWGWLCRQNPGCDHRWEWPCSHVMWSWGSVADPELRGKFALFVINVEIKITKAAFIPKATTSCFVVRQGMEFSCQCSNFVALCSRRKWQTVSPRHCAARSLPTSFVADHGSNPLVSATNVAALNLRWRVRSCELGADVSSGCMLAYCIWVLPFVAARKEHPASVHHSGVLDAGWLSWRNKMRRCLKSYLFFFSTRASSVKTCRMALLSDLSLEVLEIGAQRALTLDAIKCDKASSRVDPLTFNVIMSRSVWEQKSWCFVQFCLRITTEGKHCTKLGEEVWEVWKKNIGIWLGGGHKWLQWLEEWDQIVWRSSKRMSGLGMGIVLMFFWCTVAKPPPWPWGWAFSIYVTYKVKLLCEWLMRHRK